MEALHAMSFFLNSSFSFIVETEFIFNTVCVLCPSLQKADHGQVLLDTVFKHLELTERDYFGLHLTDDSLDTPVSIILQIYRNCASDRWYCDAS